MENEVFKTFPSAAAKISTPIARPGIQWQLKHGHYAVGHLCNDEKLEAIRLINVGPEDDHWRATYEATVLEAGLQKVSMVACAPKNRVSSLQSVLKPETIRGTTHDGVEKSVIVEDVLVVAEAAAHALAFKSYLQKINSDRDAMVISVGHGTVECGVADKDGVISETLASFPLGTAKVCDAVLARLLELGADVAIGDGISGYWDDVIIDVHDGRSRTFPLAHKSGVIKSEQVRTIVFEELEIYAKKLTSVVKKWCSKWRDRPVVLFFTGGGLILTPVKNELTTMAENDSYDLMDVGRETRLKSAAVGCRELAKVRFPKSNLIALDLGNRITAVYYVPLLDS